MTTPHDVVAESSETVSQRAEVGTDALSVSSVARSLTVSVQIFGGLGLVLHPAED